MELSATSSEKTCCARPEKHAADQPNNYSNPKSLHPVDQVKVLRVRKFLEENFLQPITLASLSREFGLNEFKLKLGFRSMFGTSVFHYVGTLRMEHAGRLIAESGMSIKEVSDALSYSAPRHFSSAFKKRYGYSPSDLKAA